MLGRKKKQKILDTADQIANVKNLNHQNATDATIEGMDLFKWKAGRLSKVGFDQSKGNLFEYIENAKLNRNLAEAGVALDQITLTDAPLSKGGFGEHTAPDDFRFVQNGKITSRAQAKFNNNPKHAAQNFVDKKYLGMQRIAPSDQVSDIKAQLDNMYNSGQISKSVYLDAIRELKKNGIEEPTTGINSGGTTISEIRSLEGSDGKLSMEAVEAYANTFELTQYTSEVANSALNGASTGAIFAGIISTVENAFKVYKNEEDIESAVVEIIKDSGKGAIRGAAVAGTSANLRIAGKKSGLSLLSDSAASTALAGGMIDCGVSLFEYADGNISRNKLVEELNSNIVKTTSVIYIAKALTLAVGTFNPIQSMIVYTIAGHVVSSAQAIIQNANLSAEANLRLEELYKEGMYQIKVYREKLEKDMSTYDECNRTHMQMLLDNFERNTHKDFDYNSLVSGMVEFATYQGIELQHVSFDTFCDAMSKDDFFVL